MGNKGVEGLKVGFICPQIAICTASCKCYSFVCGFFIVNSGKTLLQHSSFLLNQTSKTRTSWLVVEWCLTFHWLSRHSVSQGSGAENITWILKVRRDESPWLHATWEVCLGVWEWAQFFWEFDSDPPSLKTPGFSTNTPSEGEPDAGGPGSFQKL